MLAEALLHLTATSSPEARRLGLVFDAVGLWSRARRRRKAWRPHEERSCAVVESAMAGLPRRRTVLVLGSGLLRDVPFGALLAAFDRIVLVDAVHLWPARLRARPSKVECVVADLTGLGGRLRDVGARVDPLVRFRRDGDIDLVVSANLLSQMPLAAVRRIEAGPPEADGIAPDLPARIVRWHLDDLAAFRCPVCLVTDTAFVAIERDGTMADETDLMRGVALPPPDESWDWEVAPFGEVERDTAYLHRVCAWRDIGRALR